MTRRCGSMKRFEGWRVLRKKIEKFYTSQLLTLTLNVSFMMGT